MNRAKHEQPLELIVILKHNFLQDAEGQWYVRSHKVTDLEKYVSAPSKGIKEYTEAPVVERLPLRSGACRFADCFKAAGL
jgi:hypothetical protein